MQEEYKGKRLSIDSDGTPLLNNKSNLDISSNKRKIAGR